MEKILINDILPILVIMVLGYICGKLRYFDNDQRQGLNKVVLDIHSTQEAAICALIAGSPTLGFLGFAVLDPIYGNSVDTNLVIAIVSIVVNAITIPIGFYLINLGQSKDKAKALASAAAHTPQAAGAQTHTTGEGVKADDPAQAKGKLHDVLTPKGEVDVAASSNRGKRTPDKHMNPNVKAILEKAGMLVSAFGCFACCIGNSFSA